ncbi:MAG: sensor histidine kinase [Verrucomicrobiia bacterium]
MTPTLATGAPAEPSPSLLTEIPQILNLNREQAAKRLPVRLEATVTVCDEEFRMVFVQDAKAGIYVHGLSPLSVASGQRLVIKGVTGPGLLSPIIDEAKATVGASGFANPEPERMDLGQIISGQADAQFVEVEGVVHSDKVIGKRRCFEIASGLNRCEVWVLEADGGPAPNQVDARIQVRGVCAAQIGKEGRLTGFKLFAQRGSDIRVTRLAPSDLPSRPPILARDLLGYDALRRGEHRVRVQGVVTLCWPGERLVIQDNSGGVCLFEANPTNSWRVGELVDGVGFRVPAPGAARLMAAVVQPVGGATREGPAPVAITEPLQTDLGNRLVQLDAELLQASAAKMGRLTLFLCASNQSWTALVRDAEPSLARRLRSGVRLRLTGVCQTPEPADAPASKPVLWLRSPADVQVLAEPGLWHRAEALRGWTTALGVALVVTISLSFFALRRARERSVNDRRAREEELRSYVEERERIGKDMHDNIIQSVYAVGLGLEDCRRGPHSASEIDRRLAAAIRGLNGVMRDVRDFIGGLEPKALNGHELKTALKSLALTAGDSSAHFDIKVDAAATRLLTPQQATHLLNIAKEGMSNSLRHAKAQQTVVEVSRDHREVRLAITDDGVGFDPHEAVPDGKAGLRNIAARASEMNARFELVSAPGQGTRVSVGVPVQNV